MKTALASLTTLALLVNGALAQVNAPQINTPANVVVCEPIQFTWAGGTPPYDLSVLPGADPSGSALISFAPVNGTSLTWLVNIAAGTSIGLTLRDANGLTGQSAAFTINSGPTNTSCVGGPISTSAGVGTVPPPTGAPPPPPATTGGAVTTPGSTPGSATTSPAGIPGITPSGSKPVTAPTPSGSNAASTQFINIGAAGIVAAAVALLV